MRTLLALVGEAYGGAGGIAQYNRDLFGALAADGGYRIDVLPRHGGTHPEPAPAGVRQARPTTGRLSYSAAALGAAWRIQPDIVFCGHMFMAPLAALIARRSEAKLLIQIHGIEVWQKPNSAVQRAVEEADLITSVSRDTRARLLDWADIAPERVVVVSNTVGDEYQPGDRDAARARWSLGQETVLLSVGRLDRREQYKGQDRVIAALPDLIADGRDLLYLVAGEGDDRPRLEALARAAGVSDQVRFLGPVSHKDMPDLYRAADLFVLPSTGEGFGIVFLEAMACGTAALGLAAGGAVDALGEGELGAAVTEQGLQAGLRSALADPRRPALPDRTRRRFGRDAFNTRVAAAFQRLAEPLVAVA